ncbi:class I SAM-dependent methyltransferase [Kitasatospora sp. NBC_01287]|uniref:class I SAM-dependent methyltransferase n=1 Tax=Kitasatospora sp. NBC_01287 TaxID=2903573 RepID=UPI002250F3C0|nr:class I SAM-dependent methyltransferase [Kitasatospora sp. NBC_01287]MCX4744084.1 class I SAM-dependent methyltransferase [Kitasatospora sp. NBC_01287]
MPTLPPERAPRSTQQPHQHRSVAESFGADAERYDRTRPGYPQALVDRIVTACPGPAPDLLDVGCGTGIAARQFAAAGCRVLGVDPDARMAGIARRSGLQVEVATIEAWDPAGRTFDAVVSGQTWHWVDPVAGAAKAALALRPGGPLALFWNGGRPAPELAAAFAEVYRRVAPDALAARQWSRPTADPYAELCARAAEGIRAVGAFGEPEQWRHAWERSYTRAQWLDQLPTTGGHHQLPPAVLDEVLLGVGTAIDAVGGSFTMRYTTLAVTAVRTAAPTTTAPHRDLTAG